MSKAQRKRKPSQSPAPSSSAAPVPSASSSGSFQYTRDSLATIFVFNNLDFSNKLLHEAGRSFTLSVFSPLPRGNDEVAFQAFLLAYWKPLFDMISQGELFISPTLKLLNVLPMLPYIWTVDEKEGGRIVEVLRHARCDDGTPFQCMIRRLFDKRIVSFSRPGSTFTSWLTLIQGYLCDLFMQLNGNYPWYTQALGEIVQPSGRASGSESSSSSSFDQQGLPIDHSNKQMAMMHTASLHKYASACKFVASQISAFVANNEQTIRNQANAFELLNPILPASEISTLETDTIENQSVYPSWTIDKVAELRTNQYSAGELSDRIGRHESIGEIYAASELAYFIEKKLVSCSERDIGSNHLFIVDPDRWQMPQKASVLLDDFVQGCFQANKKLVYMQIAPTRLQMSVDIDLDASTFLMVATHDILMAISKDSVEADALPRLKPNQAWEGEANKLWLAYEPHTHSRTPGVVFLVDTKHRLSLM